MSTVEYEVVRALYHELFEFSPEERRRVLDERDVAESVRRELDEIFGQSEPLPIFREGALGGVAHELVEGIAAEPAETREAAPLPERIGPYRVRAKLGQGGMGVVYAVEREDSDQVAALKVLAHNFGLEDSLRRFRREAELLRELRHPGIAAFYDWGEVEVDAALPGSTVPYLAMELVDGQPLSEYAEEHRLDERQRVELVARVADAVHHAHERGIVHRDLKPPNILVELRDRDPIGQPKVLDFGIARATDADVQTVAATRTGALMGTLAYMSPEQVSGGAQEIDARSDVYALGVLMYELLTRVHPIDVRGRSISVAVELIQLAEPTRLGKTSPAFRGDLEQVVARALEKEPDRRYASAADLSWDLRAWLAGKPVTARPPSPGRRLRKLCTRRPIASAVIAIGLVTTVVMAILWRQAAAAEVLVRESEREALANETLANERAEFVARQRRGILGLSDTLELEQLTASAVELWPAHPKHADGYRDWLGSAESLALRLEEHRALRAGLEQLEPDEVALLGTDRMSWWKETLKELVDELEAFTADGGLLADVKRRENEARTLRQRSVGDHRAAWNEAIADVRARAEYGHLELVPQIGLVPLGPNEQGWWEFWHVPSGVRPERDPTTSRLVIGAETGIVLVLLPGGHGLMGAQADDPNAPHFDPLAGTIERPVHAVQLSPFLLSKYEMTRAQWWRASGLNPAMPEVDPEFFPNLPITEVNWYECTETLRRLGLVLPSEAQWEFAARGGTETPWWCGNNPSDLARFENLADISAVESEQTANPEHERWRDGFAHHAPVGSLLASPFGLHDLLGNVSEWCIDQLATYTEELAIDPIANVPGEGSAELFRAVRGAGSGDLARRARSGARAEFPAASGDYETGLRPARMLDVEETP